jgi:hypothetical protein
VTNRYSERVLAEGEAYEDSQDMGALEVLKAAMWQMRLVLERSHEGWIPGAGKVFSVGVTEAEYAAFAVVERRATALLSRSGVTVCAGCGWRAGHDSRCPLAGDGLSRSGVRPSAAAYPDDPNTSDLDDEQPVTLRLKLGDVRRARAAIRDLERGR